MAYKNCFFCNSPIIYINTSINDNLVECKICGKYSFSHINEDQFEDNKSNKKFIDDKYLISSFLRENFENDKIINLKDFHLLNMIDYIKKPKNPIESIDKIILFINSKVKTPYEYYTFELKYDYSIVFARNEQEFKYYLLSSLKPEINFLESNQNNGYRLSLNGWKRLDDIQNKIIDSKKAFVAMWFDDGMDNYYINGIKKALENTGYIPIRVKELQHNEKIDDKIIAEIKKSGLFIADFTGHRGGVYFEAGFALGLNIPVIWCCKKDHLKDIHFDTRQYNHIIWENENDLYEKLLDRIEATIKNN
jgi:nucleoside 2-deoxyribosyltransferase